MPPSLRILLFVTFLGLSAGAVVYLYRRLVRDVTEKKWLRLTAALGMIGLAVGSVVARTVFRGEAVNQGLAIALGLWFALVCYTVLSLLVVDVARIAVGFRKKDVVAPPNPERRAFLARAVAGSSVASGAALVGWGAFRAYSPAQVTEVAVKLPGLPKAMEGFKIAHLSDLHVGPILQQRYVDDLVQRANGIKPDLVAITGDLVDAKPKDIGQYVARLSNLQSRHGTYFVSGNHDHYAGWEAWSAFLAGMGVNVLRNRRVVIGEPGASFDLLGVEDYGSRFAQVGYDPDKAALDRDPTRASVLLSHQPGGFDDCKRLGLGLQLSGHTHGGQTFPATGVASLIWGARATGLSREGDSQIYTSRGCGFVGPSMRLGSPSEIIAITLLPA